MNLPGPWWAQAVTLMERLPSPDGRSVKEAEADSMNAAQRLDAWRSAHGLAACGQFQARLDDAGLTEGDLLALLAEPSATLAGRVPTPEWAQWADRVPIPATGQAGQVPQEWLDAFAFPFRPMVLEATARLTEVMNAALRPGDADIPALSAEFSVHLGHALAGLATRTLVRELHKARPRLRGDDPRARFTDFIAGLSLQDLRRDYPVLIRLVAEKCRTALAAQSELIRRYAGDRSLIIDELCDGMPGPLTQIRSGAGDLHRGGRSVSVLSFATGARVVYKPRSLAIDIRFGELIGLLNRIVPDLRLCAVKSIPRGGYGWQRYVESLPCADERAIAAFYRRQGALLALLHAINGCDIHRENLIAHGEQPMLVDTETLFHPSIAVPAVAEDPAGGVLRDSVHRIGLLPLLLVGERGSLDLSGLGGGMAGDTVLEAATVIAPGTDQMRITWGLGTVPATANRPWTTDRVGDPLDHETDLLQGFQSAYRAITGHRSEFAGLIHGAVDDEIRIVARPTGGYHRLLTESTHPDVLGNALDRDQMFDLLWMMSLADPVRQRLIRAEIADLWSGDIPLFTSKVGRRDVWTSTGVPLPGLLGHSGVAAAIDKLRSLGEGDLRTQKWVIRASLATRRPMVSQSPAPDRPVETDPDRCLDSARRIAADLCVLAFQRGDAAGWLGLELVDGRQWLVRTMGAGLSQGYCGVALFLAELAHLTGEQSHAMLARRATNRLPALLAALSQRDDLVVAIGPDDPHGLGGIASAAGRLSELLDSPALRAASIQAAELATRAGPAQAKDFPPSVIERLCGVDAQRGIPSCATPAGVPTPSLWYGLAGIGFGLLRRGFPDRVPPLTSMRREYVRSE